MTLRIVLIALTPWQPARRAARLGSSMRVMFGVIFAQTGFVAAPMTQPQTSSNTSGFWPMAAPILRSGKPCGQEKFSSKASTPARLATLDDFHPRVLVELLHDGGDEHAVGVLVLATLEFVEPDFEFAVADEFDVLPADDLRAVGGIQFRVARGDVDDLARIQADRLGDDRAPAFLEGFVDDVEVGAGRAGTDDERIRQLEAVNGGGKRRHVDRCPSDNSRSERRTKG